MKLRSVVLGLLIVPALFAAVLFAACGGDDDSGGSSGGGTGSDEKFVSDICKAGAQFSKDIDSVTKDLSGASSEKDIAVKFAKPFETFANAFSNAKPPSDLKQWHSDASKQLKDAVAALKKGDTESGLFAGDNPFPEPPQNAQDRLEKIAEKNKDCQDADFTFGQ
jgi:hypothetical protein